MNAVLGFFVSRWFLSLIGVLILAALVWFFGPLVGFLESWIVRAAIVAVLLLLWFGINFWISRRRAKADSALVRGVAASAEATPDASAEEMAAMRDKLSQALTLLRKASGKRGYLYEQPWYVIIGPPGAGKTTALLNAGLTFPLAAEMGQGAVAGVGGTRMCDWWFTDSAVLIDTAGRYTTQDSDATVDRAGWEGFLDLLKRTRVRQPLNGVIVAIAVSDIAAATPAERTAHARSIRKRIKEVTDRLGVRVPVYALFTKADLLAGFTEFFDDLDRDRRNQVWGTTFALKSAEGGALAAFPGEFKALLGRLEERLIDRLQAERSPERRAMLLGFPAQVASLEQPLMAFLQEAFGGSKLDPAPFVRGVYFTSGTQEGTPIDRLTGLLARAFGVDQRQAASLRPVQGRSFFLGKLLTDVIFGEAMLVAEKPGASRRRFLIRGGAFAAIVLATLGIGGWLWRSEVSNQAEIDATAKALAAYEQTAKPLKLDPVADYDLPAIAPLLDQARGLPHGYDLGKNEGSSWNVGLSQTDKLAVAAKSVYRHALERALLPRLVWRLEAQIRGNFGRPDFVYEATRVYLMLGSAGPLDPALVKEWERLDWEQSYAGAGAAPFRESMARHLDALLEEPLPAVSLDGGLIADARRTFSRVSLAERVYSRIRPLAAQAGIAPWRPSDALGASGVRVFMRASGKPMTDGITGLYTIDGFHKVVLPSLPRAAKEVASESWVLGTNAQIDPRSAQMQTLERDVVKLYTNEYAQHWDAMLADINVAPLGTLGQAVQNLYVLSSPQSPMRDLLASISRQLTLSVPPPPPAGVAGAVQGAAAAAATAATQQAPSGLSGLFGQTGGPPPPPPGKDIDDRYKALRDFVGSGPGAPIEGVLKLLNDLQQQLDKLASAPPGTPPPVGAGADPAQMINAEASRDPQPVARWLQAMATGGGALRGGGAKQAAAAAFAGPGGPASLCSAAVAGRYPFFTDAANEIPMDDFARLFSPGGMLDNFFNTQLRPFVDTSTRPWRAQEVSGVQPPVTPGDLAQFQRAATIRDLFFTAGAVPTVRFDITPVDLDSTARQVTLDLDGLVITYAHEPPRPTQVTWPGPNRMTSVRLVFDPPPSGPVKVLQASGPWALFRLVGKGTLVQTGGTESYNLTFQVGERKAVFEIRAASVFNPFAPGMLQDFRCPSMK